MDVGLYETFSREEWRARRAATPLTLTADDLDELRGLNEALDLDEVESVYLPLSRLVNLHAAAMRARVDATRTFLDRPQDRVPYVIGVAGSVAVGKSTAARLEDLSAVFAELHPYKVPELLALPVAAGLEKYLTWIDMETAPSAPPVVPPAA